MFYKISIALLLTVFCATASAGFVGPGSNDSLVTVSQVKDMRDDTRVTLEGSLVNEVADEYYTFQDGTGQLVVEIDHDELRGMLVTPDTKIRIRGDVDEGKYKSLIDVNFVEIVK